MQLCNRALPTACLSSRKVCTAGTISCRRSCGLTADPAQLALAPADCLTLLGPALIIGMGSPKICEYRLKWLTYDRRLALGWTCCW